MAAEPEKFVSKHSASEIESMLDKVKQDMQVIQYTQNEINTLLAKIDGLTVPTKLSDLTDDSDFIKNTVNNLTNYYKKTETYTKAEVDALVSNSASGGFIPVEELPTTNISTKGIYLVPSTVSKQKNIYDEYINPTGTIEGWEMIGDTKINLANYVTTSALNTALANYVTTEVLNTTLGSYYTKTEIDNTFNNYYTKDSIDSTLGNYYTKAEIDQMLAESNTTPDPEPTTPDPEPEDPEPTEPDPTEPENQEPTEPTDSEPTEPTNNDEPTEPENQEPTEPENDNTDENTDDPE